MKIPGKLMAASTIFPFGSQIKTIPRCTSSVQPFQSRYCSNSLLGLSDVNFFPSIIPTTFCESRNLLVNVAQDSRFSLLLSQITCDFELLIKVVTIACNPRVTQFEYTLAIAPHYTLKFFCSDWERRYFKVIATISRGLYILFVNC
jgi:hypothetical protein